MTAPRVNDQLAEIDEGRSEGVVPVPVAAPLRPKVAA